MGYDLGVVMIFGEMTYFSALTAEARFIGQGKDQILAYAEQLFWPKRNRTYMRSPSGVLYWRKCLEAMHEFTRSSNKDTLVVAPWLFGQKIHFLE